METRKVPPHSLVQLGKLQEDFNSEAARFAHMMANGGGISNPHCLDVLRNLNYLFLQTAAHLDAARDSFGQVTLETGRRALAIVRAMADESEENKQLQGQQG